MQIWLIVPPEEERREKSKGTDVGPVAFCSFVAHDAHAATRVGC